MKHIKIPVKEYNDLLDDRARLNKLQLLTKCYGKGWVLRESWFGRGMRLHETNNESACASVRAAIDNFK